jgi:hypothetical protein
MKDAAQEHRRWQLVVGGAAALEEYGDEDGIHNPRPLPMIGNTTPAWLRCEGSAGSVLVQ